MEYVCPWIYTSYFMCIFGLYKLRIGHWKVIFGLTLGTGGMQLIRMSELKKKGEKFVESRTFFVLGMVTWSWKTRGVFSFFQICLHLQRLDLLEISSMFFFGRLPLRVLMVRRSPHTVDDLPIYPVKIHEHHPCLINRIPDLVMGLLISSSRTSSSYCWGVSFGSSRRCPVPSGWLMNPHVARPLLATNRDAWW